MSGTSAEESSSGEGLRETVRRKYGEAAERATDDEACGCGCEADPSDRNPVSRDLYDAAETLNLPDEAVQASLGCGNPTALADLRPGEVVLDLGSGGGIDVLLSARRVGPSGMAYGVDMTDEMLELARENRRKAGVENVEFLEGEIEDLPLPDAWVDVIISNCVVNLSGDKPTVMKEAFRVLAPGGRLAISDVVVRGQLPPEVRRSMELWVGCVAGALSEDEFRRILVETGFEAVEIEPTRTYGFDEAREVLEGAGVEVDGLAEEVGGRLMAAFVRARKPR